MYSYLDWYFSMKKNWEISTPPQPTNSQNSIISFGCVNFYAKIVQNIYTCSKKGDVTLAATLFIHAWRAFMPEKKIEFNKFVKTM